MSINESNIIVCPNCRRPVNTATRFCKYCAFDFNKSVGNIPVRTIEPGQLQTCPGCGTIAKASATFCSNCGRAIIATAPEGQTFISLSTHTGSHPVLPVTSPSTPKLTIPSQRGTTPQIIAAIVIALLFIGALIYFLSRGNRQNDVRQNLTLPGHFGLFITDNGKLNELRRRDVSDMLRERDTLMTEAAIPVTDAHPTFILYAERQDMSIGELKLLKVDSIDDRGNLSYWNYQVAPVEGHSEMRQLSVTGGLASGKYAFALIGGYINEGNHKLWPFQVENGAPVPSDPPQASTIPLKPRNQTPAISQTVLTPTPIPPTSTSPNNMKAAYCTSDNVVLRNGPNLEAGKVGRLSRGQRLWVISVSSNYTTWKGINSNWTEVQLDNPPVRGWVFSYFVAYD